MNYVHLKYHVFLCSHIIPAGAIKVYYYLFLVPVGVAGNILSFLVRYNLCHNVTAIMQFESIVLYILIVSNFSGDGSATQ